MNVLDNARETIDDIERDEFVPQTFTSNSLVKKLPEKVKIDLKNEQIILPVIEEQEPEDQLINPEFFGGDADDRMRRWVRKLLSYRQRAREARRQEEQA